VGQGGEGRVEVGERAEVAVEARDRASALAVHEQAELRRRLLPVHQAEAGRDAERDQLAAHDLDQPDRARALGDHRSAFDQERLRQRLERRDPQAWPPPGREAHQCHGHQRGGAGRGPAVQRPRQHDGRGERPARRGQRQRPVRAEQASRPTAASAPAPAPSRSAR
jgi:hypothetical protein